MRPVWIQVSVAAVAMLVIAGCTSARNPSARLQAQLRRQAEQLTDAQMQLDSTRRTLDLVERERDSLQTQLAAVNTHAPAPELTSAVAAVERVRISTWQSGGLNRDDVPGDELLVVHFTPLDAGDEPVKLAGPVEVTVLDPGAIEGGQSAPIITQRLSPAEYRDRWTTGIAGAGYQLHLPWSRVPTTEKLVVRLNYSPGDGRQFEATEMVRVEPPATGSEFASIRRTNEAPKTSDADFATDSARQETPRVVQTRYATSAASEAMPEKDSQGWPTDLGQDEPGISRAAAPRSGDGTPPTAKAKGAGSRAKMDRNVPLRDSTNWTESSLPTYR